MHSRGEVRKLWKRWSEPRGPRRPFCGDRISHSFSSRPPLSCGCSLSPGITTTKRSPNVTSSAQPQATTATTRDRRRPRDEGSDMERSKRTGPNASKRQPNVTEGRRRPRPLDEDYGVVLVERSQSRVTKAKRKPNRHVQGSNLRGLCPMDFKSIALTSRPT